MLTLLAPVACGLLSLTVDSLGPGVYAAYQREPFPASPGLMRAFTRFVETDSDEAFRKKALGIIGTNYKRLEQVLLEFPREIAHADKPRAVRFALLTMATVIEVRALEDVSMWRELLPMSERQLTDELTRTMVGYLRGRATMGTPTRVRGARRGHTRQRGRSACPPLYSHTGDDARHVGRILTS